MRSWLVLIAVLPFAEFVSASLRRSRKCGNGEAEDVIWAGSGDKARGWTLNQIACLVLKIETYKLVPPGFSGEDDMARISIRMLALYWDASCSPRREPRHRLVTTQKLSAALVNELVGESVAECAKKNYTVTAVVVDFDGVRQGVLRGNGAPIHTLSNTFYKVYSSASLKRDQCRQGRPCQGKGYSAWSSP
jgi:hypothetical protein